MLTPDQEKLKEAALAATPGKWDSRESRVYLPLNAGGFDIRNSPNSEANAAYIAAANPAAILAILAQLEQVQGDARLIAAAQNLLTALELAIRVINNECDPDEYAHPIAEINAAITKATAGQPLPPPPPEAA